MILFVVEQIAGAEYILPLVKGPLREKQWTIISSAISSSLLKTESVPHQIMEDSNLVEAFRIVARLKPRIALISASAGSALEKCFVKALKQNEITCVQFIDMWVNYRKRFETIDGAERSYPDLILTLDEKAKSGMEAEGIPGELIEVVGQPYLESMMRKYYLGTQVSTPRNRVLIVTQPIARYYGKTLGYDEIDFVELCLGSLRSAGVDFRLVDICVHPAESVEAYENIIRRFSDQISLLRNANLHVSRYEALLAMFSSLLIHGLLSGARVASVQPGSVRVDVCLIDDIARLHTRSDVVQWIQTRGDIDPRASRERFGFLNGSTERVAKLLSSYQRRPNVD